MLTLFAVVLFVSGLAFVVVEFNKLKGNAIQTVVQKRLGSFEFDRESIFMMRLELALRGLYVTERRIIDQVNKEMHDSRVSNVKFDLMNGNFAIPQYTY